MQIQLFFSKGCGINPQLDFQLRNWCCVLVVPVSLQTLQSVLDYFTFLKGMLFGKKVHMSPRAFLQYGQSLTYDCFFKDSSKLQGLGKSDLKPVLVPLCKYWLTIQPLDDQLTFVTGCGYMMAMCNLFCKFLAKNARGGSWMHLMIAVKIVVKSGLSQLTIATIYSENSNSGCGWKSRTIYITLKIDSRTSWPLLALFCEKNTSHSISYFVIAEFSKYRKHPLPQTIAYLSRSCFLS